MNTYAPQTADLNAICTIVNQCMQQGPVMIEGPCLGRNATL